MSDALLFESVSLWLILWGTVALVLISIYGGVAFTRFRIKRSGKDDETPVNTAVGASMALLGFVLAFTFGLTLSRFDARRELLLSEVNSIGTTFLRTDLIPEPHRSAVRGLLREYVDIRVELISHPEEARQAVRQSDQLQSLMWPHAAALAQTDLKNGPIAALFVNSLNEMFDMQTRRVTVALTYRIPWPMWTALYGLIVFSMFETGCLLGASKKVNWTLALVLSLAFSTVVLLIADLDRGGAGGAGIIKIDPKPMIDLQQKIAEQMK